MHDMACTRVLALGTPARSASSPGPSGPPGSSVAAKRARMESSPQHGSKNYMRYGTSLYGRFLKQTSTGKMASKKTFHLRYKERNGPKAVRETDGKLYWIHPDNESNKYLVTEENFADAMKRCRHDYELARNKQPNARIPGMGAKEGFRKNAEPNNTHYDKDGEVMAKWTMSIYWGTDDSRGMRSTLSCRRVWRVCVCWAIGLPQHIVLRVSYRF